MSFFWPFAQNPSGAIPETITYDLIISENYPGVCFQSTLPGSPYAEMRLVNGCLWFVTNATFNTTTLAWEQDAPPCNPALNAYALVQCQDGTLTRYIAQATNTIGGAVAWVAVLTDDANGGLTIAPLLLTAQGEVAEKVDPTWNAGAGASMIARQVNVTDQSSSAQSYLDQLNVNGVTKWEVDKTGTLTVGIVPASLVPGVVDAIEPANPAIINVTQVGHVATVSAAHGDYLDLANAQTVTGTKTIADAISLLLGSATGEEGALVASSVFGGTCLSYGAKYTGAAFVWQAEAASALILRLDPVNGFTLYFNTGLIVGNTFAPSEVFNVNNAGQITTTSPIEPSVLASEFEGTNGVSVSYDGGTNKVDVDGSALVETVQNTDGNLAVTRAGQVVTVNAASGGTPGGSLIATGGGSGGTIANGISITLPGTNANTFDVVLLFNFNGNANNNSSITIDVTSGAVTQITNTGDGTVSQNASYYSVAMYVGNAVGGQTISFSATIAGVGFGTYGWLLQAVKR